MKLKTKRSEASAGESTGKPSIYDRIGGADAIHATVEQFYRRVLDDPKLKPFFAGTSMAWLKERQKRYFTQALGGPAIYSGRPMREAHARLAIEQHHFDLVAGHLVDTFDALGVNGPLVDEVVALVAPLAAVIVNSKSPDSLKAYTEAN